MYTTEKELKNDIMSIISNAYNKIYNIDFMFDSIKNNVHENIEITKLKNNEVLNIITFELTKKFGNIIGNFLIREIDIYIFNFKLIDLQNFIENSILCWHKFFSEYYSELMNLNKIKDNRLNELCAVSIYELNVLGMAKKLSNSKLTHQNEKLEKIYTELLQRSRHYNEPKKISPEIIEKYERYKSIEMPKISDEFNVEKNKCESKNLKKNEIDNCIIRWDILAIMFMPIIIIALFFFIINLIF